MSKEDTIITSLVYERAALCQVWAQQIADSDEGTSINFYGRRMLRMADKKKIRPDQSDEQIAKAITPVLAWLFWQIAPDLLLWIVASIRRRIWNTAGAAQQ